MNRVNIMFTRPYEINNIITDGQVSGVSIQLSDEKALPSDTRYLQFNKGCSFSINLESEEETFHLKDDFYSTSDLPDGTMKFNYANIIEVKNGVRKIKQAEWFTDSGACYRFNMSSNSYIIRDNNTGKRVGSAFDAHTEFNNFISIKLTIKMKSPMSMV